MGYKQVKYYYYYYQFQAFEVFIKFFNKYLNNYKTKNKGCRDYNL